jgi:superfamily II DNA or RNA helicase
MRLRDYQSEAVDSVFGYFERGGSGNPLIVAPTGCHQKGTDILMFDGSVKPVEEVRVGDKVMGPDSEPREVLVLARGRDQMYRITPKKGAPFVVNGGHILSLATTNEGKSYSCCTTGEEVDNISVRDYLNKSKSWKHLRKLRRTEIDFPEIERPELSPWALGALIGDGCLVYGINFTNPDFDIMDALYDEMISFGLKCGGSQKKGSPAWSIYFGLGRGIDRSKNRVWQILESLRLAGLKSEDKFIPDCYKLGSRSDRLDILAGLLDTDGHLSKNSYDYISKSRQLSNDVAFVSRSLGLCAIVSECDKYCQTGNGGMYWRVCISGDTDMIPMRCIRKKAQPRKQKKRSLVCGFSVEELPEDRFYGFLLNRDHLYVTGDFVVHHNSGKSLILAELARRVVRDHASRVMVLAHRRELLQQNADKLARIDPDLDIGVYSAGLNGRDVDSDILFAGVQSVYDRAKALSSASRPIELLFVDEAHLVPFDGGMYCQLIADLKSVNRHLRIVGCTATPWRYRRATKTMSGGYDLLTEGEGAVFDEIVYDMQDRIPEMISAGHLAPLWPATVGYGVNLVGVRMRNGDFEEAELNRIMASDEVVSAILNDAIPRAVADQRHHWLVFCSGVESGRAMLYGLRGHGIDAEMVTGNTPAGERDRIVQAFVGGWLRCLVSVNVLGVGFDAPNADLIVMCRPTVSPIIHVQYIGRGCRPTQAKMTLDESGRARGCMVLDYVGNVERHGPIDAVRVKAPAPKKPPPMRNCPSCEELIPIQAKICPHCGADLVAAENEKKDKPLPALTGADIIAGLGRIAPATQTGKVLVTEARYSAHLGQSGITTLRVDYHSGLLRVVSEWVCFNHDPDSFPRRKALEWFANHVGESYTPPKTVDEFMLWNSMGMPVKRPVSVTVRKRKGEKYLELVRVRLEESEIGVAA